MKNVLLLIVAILLFIIVAPFGIAYTAVYYIRHEKNKQYSYSYRIAFAIDVLANCMFGELFELMFAKKRLIGYFGRSTSISASIGHLEYIGNLNSFGKWFSKTLDFCFMQNRHCFQAFESEILQKNG